MTIEEVTAIWSDALSRAKPFLKEGLMAPDKDGKLPEMWNGYARSYWQRRQLLPHIIYGDFPEHLFTARAPNQTEKELKWLRDNYKQVTLPVFLDMENTVGRAMHERNWALEFESNVQGEDVEEYVTKGIKEWGSIAAFIKFAGIRTMVSDAMGVLMFAPSSIDVVEREDGEMVVDPDGEISPDIHYIVCDDVWGFEYDRWYLLKRPERSMVSYGNTMKPWGLVAWLVDGDQIWRIEQTGKLTDWTFRIEVLFAHGIGFPPCIHWGGTPAYHGTGLVWESPYLAVKDILDVALLQEHYLRASEAKCVYPHMVVIGSPCDFYDKDHNAMCSGGKLQWSEDHGGTSIMRERECPTCNGTGMRMRLSPMGQVIINPNQDQTGSENSRIDATNALAFVSPSTETLRYIWERYEGNLHAARKIMHLDAEAPMAGGEAKTATEAGLNARAKDAFVKPIADRLFVVMDFAIMAIGKMRHGTDWQEYTLRPPSHYDLRTDADLLAEIAGAMERGMPPAIIDYLVWQYVSSRYGNEPQALEAFEVVLKADRLTGMGAALVQAEAAAGRVQPWEILLHFGGIGLWERLLSETPRLVVASIDEKIDALVAKAKEEAPAQQAQGSNAPINRLMNAVAA